ncbi:hypothetical protein R50073_33610 [Maricurvus nonylphenolicus]|uniref:hypothetical protein n=1 Tax=Maricurvus nonylphenolicus TaxID=1008307 RepID=UPI0036F39849
MGLIFKIAAGVIIGLLTIQIVSMKLINYENKRKGEELHLAQELRNRSIILMNSVHFYYKKHKKLPTLLADLNCTSHGKCAAEEKDSVFYIAYQDEWIVVEPYIISSDVKYHCKATFLDRIDPRFHHCIKIDELEIPQSIKDSAIK